MDYNKILEHRPFCIWDEDPNIELCYNLAYEKLGEMYPNNQLFASDCFGISIIDCSNEISTYSTGRLGLIGPLAMRDERRKEIFLLLAYDSSYKTN